MEEQKPLRVNIRVERRESPLGEMLTGENAETRLETAWKTSLDNGKHTIE